jgi:hypothetical protein
MLTWAPANSALGCQQEPGALTNCSAQTRRGCGHQFSASISSSVAEWRGKKFPELEKVSWILSQSGTVASEALQLPPTVMGHLSDL